MSSSLAPYVGGIAAFLASLSYIPQVRKAWPKKSTDDLSLGMLTSLTLGLGLWTMYGFMQGDWVIVLANVVGATLSGIVLGCKIRDTFA
ncbi:MtN3 and saliva related transmembrane protein [Bradyrhizobium japonicum]|uniref:SemiSWEET family sugar transporter n=1 Tax=Bradyrhizobium TaxID=374 RepID=UPI0003FB91A5|nr:MULTISPECIES: SemiSWEET transporter [Bradyrhizobium]MBR0881257.1 SemiSWEET transporter [Bradyrhizobium liaoningense]MBR1004433.1 SemiSWEET transporter [Bradyrhizobium liaoningense]MBR1067461.1 SemiSWEET transporter [Bradyrhizobium liaoningense]MCP1775152.1 MtN3 and saliva related transmembrane protein [Bradyrhizobium japonicum]MCP1863641.1 MtN3 and saliva related transmembrane protein [Bradyrhizobium japonicum]